MVFFAWSNNNHNKIELLIELTLLTDRDEISNLYRGSSIETGKEVCPRT